MAEVFLGRLDGASGFSRTVIMKGLLPELHANPIVVELFRKEALLMCHLDHPNIVQAFDFAMVDGRPYIVMEHVRGRDLQRVLRQANSERVAIPAGVTLSIVSQVLRALDYTHELSDEGGPLDIVHSDVSPENILIGYHGEVKITDFGIAQSASERHRADGRTIHGKPRYLAPEVLAGGLATRQSDVYSAGVVLAEALIGTRIADRGRRVVELGLLERAREEIVERSRAPASVKQVLFRSLSPAPNERYQTAIEMALELETCLSLEGLAVSGAEVGNLVRGLFSRDDDAGPAEEQRSTVPGSRSVTPRVADCPK